MSFKHIWTHRRNSSVKPMYTENMIPTLLSPAAPEIVITTTCVATRKVGAMTHTGTPLVFSVGIVSGIPPEVNFSPLAQVMVCRPLGAKPLPEPMLTYCQLVHWEQISVKFESKWIYFHSIKCFWKCRLRNGGYFVQGGDNLTSPFYENIYGKATKVTSRGGNVQEIIINQDAGVCYETKTH